MDPTIFGNSHMGSSEGFLGGGLTLRSLGVQGKVLFGAGVQGNVGGLNN